jgi:hypothetical protein
MPRKGERKYDRKFFEDLRDKLESNEELVTMVEEVEKKAPSKWATRYDVYNAVTAVQIERAYFDYITKSGGDVPTLKQLARIVKACPKVIRRRLAELKLNDVKLFHKVNANKVLEVLSKRALEGDIKAIALYLQVVMDYQPSQTINQNTRKEVVKIEYAPDNIGKEVKASYEVENEESVNVERLDEPENIFEEYGDEPDDDEDIEVIDVKNFVDEDDDDN